MIHLFLVLMNFAFGQTVSNNCSKVNELTAVQVDQCLGQIQASNLHWQRNQAEQSAVAACAILGMDKDNLVAKEAAIIDPTIDPLIVKEMERQRAELEAQIVIGEEFCTQKTAQVGRLKAAVKVESELKEKLLARQQELADALTPEELAQAANVCTDLRKKNKDGKILTSREQDELVLACEDEINWAKQYGPRRPPLKPAHLLTLER